MIEKHYILDKGSFTIFEAYIEPEHEWCRMKQGDGEWVKIFNDINPVTGNRTGKYYQEDCVFGTVEAGKEGLKDWLDKLIEENRTKIGALQEKNIELLQIKLSIK